MVGYKKKKMKRGLVGKQREKKGKEWVCGVGFRYDGLKALNNLPILASNTQKGDYSRVCGKADRWMDIVWVEKRGREMWTLGESKAWK